MTEPVTYTADDCSETGCAMSIKNKVIVVKAELLPENHPGQLFLCTGGFGAEANPNGRSVFAVSLSTGEHCRWYRGDVIGPLKPELLPDDAKMYLSQIRPGGAREAKDPEYTGYCILEDGRYGSGAWLQNARETVEYMEMQALYQHKVLICDRDDFAVAEMVKGKLIYPTWEALEAFRQSGAEPGQTGGMTMT